MSKKQSSLLSFFGGNKKKDEPTPKRRKVEDIDDKFDAPPSSSSKSSGSKQITLLSKPSSSKVKVTTTQDNNSAAGKLVSARRNVKPPPIDLDSDDEEISITQTTITTQNKQKVAQKLPDHLQTGPASAWQHTYCEHLLAQVNFDPSQLPSNADTQNISLGKPFPFQFVCSAFSLIEEIQGSGKGSRKAQTVVLRMVLTNLFRSILYYAPADLVPTIYISINKLAPDYQNLETGVGEHILVQAICDVFGRNPKQIKQMMKSDCEDLGQVAMLSRMTQNTLFKPAPLTTKKVFDDFTKLAQFTGAASQKNKKDIFAKMLVAAEGDEAKFVIRFLEGKMRIGIRHPTILQSLAWAFVLSPLEPTGNKELPWIVRADIRSGENSKNYKQLDQEMVDWEAAVKQAFCELPNYQKLCDALMSGANTETLSQFCKISPGIPVKPMLAKPTKGITEILDRFQNIDFTAEWKYDGERAQIHIMKDQNSSTTTVKVFSRKGKECTQQYPEMVALVLGAMNASVQNCIIDSEVVAYDYEKKTILPFQTLSHRANKDVQIEDIKIHIKIFAFDILYLNNESLLQKSLRQRRTTLHSAFTEGEKFNYADCTDAKEPDELTKALDSAVDGICEGLMLKTLDQNASYEPAKRSLNWLKLKKDYIDSVGDSLDVVPIGAFYGKGKRTGVYGSYLLSIYSENDEEFQTVSKCHTGYTEENLQSFWEFFTDGRILSEKRSDYNVHENMYPDVWLDASVVWEVRCADLSISPVHTSAIGMKANARGIALRFPRFIRKRDDKAIEDSTSPEQIVSMFKKGI